MKNGIQAYFDDLIWLNFWDEKDPVSGSLDFYWVDYKLDGSGRKEELAPAENPPAGTNFFRGNRECKLNAKWGVAHTAYWQHTAMYQAIADEMLFS